MRRIRRGRVIRGLLAMTGLMLLAGGIYAAGWSGIFSIKKISCQVDRENECSAELKAELNKYLNKNLLTIRPSQIENRVILTERLAQSAEADLIFPDSLNVNITSRRAIAAITTADSVKDQVEVDKEGVILGKSQNTGELPRLAWPEISKWPIENPVPENIAKAAIIASLAGEKFQLEGIARVESQSSMAITLKSGEKIRLSLTSDPVEQLAMLQLVLNQAKIEGKPVGEIDMRFENPVIR